MSTNKPLATWLRLTTAKQAVGVPSASFAAEPERVTAPPAVSSGAPKGVVVRAARRAAGLGVFAGQ